MNGSRSERNRPGEFRTDVSTTFGELAIMWREITDGVRVTRIGLPGEVNEPPFTPAGNKTHADASGCTPINKLAARIQRFLEGEAVTFDIDLLGWEICSPFQKKVLLAEYGIPRGRVSTYGRIARHIGYGRAPRAVGRALATNPFPIVIPCHRAVQADGRLGGFRGGIPMKRALLRLEDITVTSDNRVVVDGYYY